MNQSDMWQYSTRVNPHVTSVALHHFKVSVIGRWTDVRGQGGAKGNEPCRTVRWRTDNRWGGE
jgi:hypothetical protein